MKQTRLCHDIISRIINCSSANIKVERNPNLQKVTTITILTFTKNYIVLNAINTHTIVLFSFPLFHILEWMHVLKWHIMSGGILAQFDRTTYPD